MDHTPFDPSYLRDPRLARYALSAEPAWLCRTTGRRILWCNAAGAAAFGASTVSELLAQALDPEHPAAAEIARLAKSLQSGAPPRLEPLAGFGGDMQDSRVCEGSRFTLSNHAPAILIVGAAIGDAPLPLRDRVLRLFEGTGHAMAVFPPDGSLLYATASGREYVGGARTLADLGAETLAQEALTAGWAAGNLANGYAVFDRLDADGGALVSATFVVCAPSGRDHSLPEQHVALRFAWQMDAEGCFMATSNELLELVGTDALPADGRPWSELNADLGLDPAGAVAQAMAARSTFSAIAIAWPLEDGTLRLQIDLSGLPVFDRGMFVGYRGFGICRDLQPVADTVRVAAPRDAEIAPAPERDIVFRAELEGPSRAAPAPPPRVQERIALVGDGQNVIPFRTAAPADAAVGLSAVEHQAFSEIGRELSARLGETEQPHPWALRHEAATMPAGEVQERAPSASPLPASQDGGGTRALLDRLPLPVLVYGSALHYANPAFLALAGHPDLGAFERAGGLERLLRESHPGTAPDVESLPVQTVILDQRIFDATTFVLPWDGDGAQALVLLERPVPALEADTGIESAEPGGARGGPTATQAENQIQKPAAQPPASPDAAVLLSGEIRTALNAIAGFAETMLQERFGPIGNERYRAYLGDICSASEHVLELLAPQPEAPVVSAAPTETEAFDLNELTGRCVTQFQTEAKLVQVLIRTSLLPGPTTVGADPRGVRELIGDLLIHAIKCTKSGGQVIVSTAGVEDRSSGAARMVLRVRGTGGRLSPAELAAALDDSAATPADPESAGFALAQAKAGAEAVGAQFAIAAGANNSTVASVTFPPLPPSAPPSPVPD